MKISIRPIYINLDKISDEILTTEYNIKLTINIKLNYLKWKMIKDLLCSYNL